MLKLRFFDYRTTMRYAKTKKSETRERILTSAYALFSAKGFNAVAIDDVMRACGLTRGGFYAHFRSKGVLYREAMKHAMVRGHLALSASDEKPSANLEEKLLTLIDECIAFKQGDEEIRARFAFLASDLASASTDVRASYALAIATLLNQLAVNESGQRKPDNNSLTAAFAMIVGAAAIVRSVDDHSMREQFLAACKRMSEVLSNSVNERTSSSVLWEGLYGDGFRKLSTAAN